MANVKEMDKTTEMQERMKKMKEWGTPGAPHRMLAKLAGKWKSTVRSWVDPSKPALVETGTNEQKSILEGHYLQQMETGTMGGVPYSGLGITGYDNQAGKYFMTWMDSMSTGMMLFEGEATADGKTITLGSDFNDPVSGHVTNRAVLQILDDNNYTFDMFRTDKTGTEQKVMEITYTRAK